MKKLLALLIICILLSSCNIGGNKMAIVQEGSTSGSTWAQIMQANEAARYALARWGQPIRGYTTSPPNTTSYPTVTPYGETGYGYTPPMTTEGQTPWQQWQPYLQGLGIIPQSSGYLTATSEATRGRMNPLALAGMQDYYTGMGNTWADYLNWSNMFMPRTPNLQQRRWMPWMWR